MKKILSAMLATLIIFMLCPFSMAAKKPPQIISEAAVVMDSRTGQVLFNKNMDEKLFPASITKILTCALALEKGDPTGKTVTMTDEAVWSVGRETTHIALTTDEIIPVNDLLHATMMQSANDAANGLALYVSGNLPDFAKCMTQRAHEMGAESSNFTNASGLPEPEHVTTAYDMAAITRSALNIKGFRELFGEKEYVMSPTNKQPQSRRFATKHLMLTEGGFYYADATGGKLGWTEEALHTSVTLAKRGDLELICVTMKSKDANDKFVDTTALFDYCFTSFNNVTFPPERFAQSPIPLIEGGMEIGTVSVSSKEITILKPSTAAKADIKIDMDLPIRYEGRENINPKVKFILNNQIMSEVPLEYKLNMFSTEEIATVAAGGSLNPKKKIEPWMVLTASGIFLAISLLFLIRAFNIMRRNKRQNEKRRLMALRDVERTIIEENNEKNQILFPSSKPKNVSTRPPTARRIRK